MFKNILSKSLSLQDELYLGKADKFAHLYDGIQYGSNVDNFNERKLHAKVVDNILSFPTLYSRLLGKGTKMEGKTMDYTIDVVPDTQGEFFIGLETLNSSYVETTITLSYAQTAFTQPKVGKMLDAFANQGSTATIDLNVFKYKKAAAEAMQRLGSAIYADGTLNRPNGLGLIVSDSGTIGGQARSTYPMLNATNTPSGGTLTLAKMATLDDNTSVAGMGEMTTGIMVTTKAIWSLYESLLMPTVRNNFNASGYSRMGVRSNTVTRGDAPTGNLGFSILEYRGKPMIKDEFAPAGSLYDLNEDSFGYVARTIVPDEYKSFITKVNLGTDKAYEGIGAEALDLPSEYNGWFYQKDMVMPNQAGTVGRFYVIGQFVCWEPRRNGVLTGITSV